MHLNHINLCASDVGALRRTLERHFGYRTVQSGRVPEGVAAARPGDFAMLQGTDGSSLVVTQIDAPADGGSAYPPGFHFGVLQDSADAVRAKHDELAAAGLAPGPISEFAVLGASWTAFFCPLGDGLEIEVNHRTRSAELDD